MSFFLKTKDFEVTVTNEGLVTIDDMNGFAIQVKHMDLFTDQKAVNDCISDAFNQHKELCHKSIQ